MIGPCYLSETFHYIYVSLFNAYSQGFSLLIQLQSQYHYIVWLPTKWQKQQHFPFSPFNKETCHDRIYCWIRNCLENACVMRLSCVHVVYRMSYGHLDRHANPCLWLRSGFKYPQGPLDLSFFQYPISYVRFTGATLHVPCLAWGMINLIQFPKLTSTP